MNQIATPHLNRESVPTHQSVSRDWSMQRFLDNQEWQAVSETEWETNPSSWKNPSECPWNETLDEKFNRVYEDVPTQLDAMVTVLYPEMTEQFMDAMISNLMFKRGTLNPNFPPLFEMSKYKESALLKKRDSNEKMDLIAKEVIDFLIEQKIPYSKAANPVFPSLVAKMK